MKNFSAVVFTLLLSINLFAAPLPAEKIKKINDYILKTIGEEIKVTKVDIDEKTELLTSIALNANAYDGAASLDLEAKFANKEVTLGALVSGSRSVFSINDQDDVMEYVNSAKDAVERINKRGDYKAVLVVANSPEGTAITIQITPATNADDLSIKEATIKAYIPNDPKGQVLLSASGVFKASAENVKNAQIALTNILNDMSNGKRPAEEDMEMLNKIIAEILSSIR